MKLCKDCRFFEQINILDSGTCGHSNATFETSHTLIDGSTCQWSCVYMRQNRFASHIGFKACGVKGRLWEPRQ